MPELIFNTTEIESSYDPIKIVIDGRTYIFDKKVSTEFMKEIDKWREEEAKGNLEAGARQLMMVTGMNLKEAMKIDQRVILEIMTAWATAIIGGEKKVKKKMKEKPGNEK